MLTMFSKFSKFSKFTYDFGKNKILFGNDFLFQPLYFYTKYVLIFEYLFPSTPLYYFVAFFMNCNNRKLLHQYKYTLTKPFTISCKLFIYPKSTRT